MPMTQEVAVGSGDERNLQEVLVQANVKLRRYRHGENTRDSETLGTTRVKLPEVTVHLILFTHSFHRRAHKDILVRDSTNLSATKSQNTIMIDMPATGMLREGISRPVLFWSER